MPKSSLSGKPGGRSLQVGNRSALVGAVPVVLRTCLTEQDLRDLHVIWSRDQRIPTPASRQKWAQHRGLAPATVGGWFSRRRARHIRLAGDEAALTGSYELNPSSPSNVAPHELPVKVQVRGSRARTVRGANFGSGSERTDPDLSSDDTTFYHPGRLDQEANLAATTETVTVMDSSGGEALPSRRLPSPPSPSTLWFPWSVQAETVGQPHPSLNGTGALELFPNSEFTQGVGHSFGHGL